MVAFNPKYNDEKFERRVRGADGRNKVIKDMTYDGIDGTKAYKEWIKQKDDKNSSNEK